MKIKKISKINLITVIAAGAVLALPLAFVFQTATVDTKLLSKQAQARNVTSISATELKTTSTWTADMYQDTQGLYFYGDDDSIPKNNWIYQINKNGLSLNEKYPQYNKIQSVMSNGAEFTLPEFQYPNTGISMYSTFENGEYAPTYGDSKYNLAFTVGGSKISKFTGVQDFKANFKTPFFKVDLLRWDWKYKLAADAAFNNFTNTTFEDMLISNKNYQAWDGQFSNYTPYTALALNPDVVTKSKDGLDFEVTFDVNQISVFNDYDLEGNYLNTYMYPDGAMAINSAFAVNVDESKLDKSLPADNTSLANLKEMASLVLNNVPQNFRKNMRLEVQPNNANGSILFSLYSKYIVENGEIIENPYPAISVADYTASGFLLTSTVISVLANPAKIRVDEFTNSVAPGGVVNRIELAKYLDLTTIPATATIQLTVTSPANLVTGAIEIELIIDKYLDLDGNEVTGTAKFNLPMTLTPRITTLEVIQPSAAIPIDDVATTFFGADGIATTTFYDYFKFDVIPNGSVVTLKSGTVVKNPGSGLISFDVNLSTYYAKATAELANNGTFKITDFGVQAPITSVQKISTHPTNIRADYFLKSVADVNGGLTDRYLVNNLTLLKQFVKFNALPAGDIFIKKEPVVDKTTGDFTFNLILANANDGNGVIINDWESPSLSFKLLPTPGATDFAAKITYDKTIATDDFIASLLPDGVLDLSFLKKYVDFIGNLPSGAVLSIDNDIVSDLTKGEITFKILASSYYDSSYTEQVAGVFPISLVLAPKYNPTTVTLKANYNKNLQARLFMDYIAPANVLNKTKLLEFIEINQEDLLHEIAVEIDYNNTAISPTTGFVNLGLLLSNYYDADSELITTKGEFQVKIPLAPQAEATKLTRLPTYNKNLTVAEFIAAVDNSGEAVRAEIEKFIIIENLDSAAVINITIDSQDAVLGTVSFTLSGIGKDADGNNQNYSQGFTLQLLADGAIPAKTVLQTLTPDLPIFADTFITKMIVNNQVNLALLSQYVDLSLLPQDAIVAIKDNKISVSATNPNQFDFILTYDKAFNGKTATPNVGAYEYDVKIVLNSKQPPTVITAKAHVTWEFSVDDLWLAISTKGKVDQTKIAQYVDLSTLPPNTTVNANYSDISKDTTNGVINLAVTVDKYYDENGDYYEGLRTYQFSFRTIAAVRQDLKINDLLWVYISVGLVGLVIIVSVFLLVRRKKNARKFYDFRKDQY